jgi:phosphate transport system protein
MAREKYSQELGRVRSSIGSLSEKVCDALDASMECILRWDKKGEAKVVASHSRINASFLEIEEHCMGIIASQQPVASDLRFVIASFEAARRLERCGDYASQIAQTTLLLKPRIKVGIEELSLMHKTAVSALRISVDGFVGRDLTLDREVFDLEKENDGHYKKLLEALKPFSTKSLGNSETAFRTFLIGHYYERAADNATRIANATRYMVSADSKCLAD